MLLLGFLSGLVNHLDNDLIRLPPTPAPASNNPNPPSDQSSESR